MDCKYLVIGNSAGAIAAVEAIREVDREGECIMVAAEKYQAYSRALIPYYLAGEFELEKMYYRAADFYVKNNIRAILGEKAVRIDFLHKEVEIADGQRIRYGKLLLATGSLASVPIIEGLSYSYDSNYGEKFDKEGVFTFTSLDDAIEIKRRVESGFVKKAVVLGGGRIGLMAAEALIRNRLDVTVIKRSERLLPEVFDGTASRMVKSHLKESGLRMLIGHTLKAVTGERSVEGVILNDGTEIKCALLIIAAGVGPRAELVRDTEVKINRGIVVDRRMKTSVPDVYACGDCAEVYDFAQQDYRLTPVWAAAYAGGRIAGFNMCGLEKEYRWGTNMNSMHFFGLSVITAGISAEDEENGNGYAVLKEIDEEKKIYEKIVIRDNRLIGMILMNKIERGGIFLGLMRAGINVSSFKEELLSDDFGLISLPEELRRGICTGTMKW